MTQPTTLEILVALAESVCDSYAKQYEDYSKTFVALDAKAQATATIGGVLLATIVALANAGKLASLLKCGSVSGVLLALSPALAAFVAICIALFASRARPVSAPYDAARQHKEFEDYMRLRAEVDQETLLSFHAGRLNHWKTCLESVAKAVNEKGDQVARAQIAMVIAAVLTLVVSGVALTR